MYIDHRMHASKQGHGFASTGKHKCQLHEKQQLGRMVWNDLSEGEQEKGEDTSSYKGVCLG
jgi:hypothetical protein